MTRSAHRLFESARVEAFPHIECSRSCRSALAPRALGSCAARGRHVRASHGSCGGCGRRARERVMCASAIVMCASSFVRSECARQLRRLGSSRPGARPSSAAARGRGQARQLPLARRALHDSCSANRAIARPTRSALSCSEKHMGSCVSRALARVEELHSLVAQLRSLFAQFVQRRGSRAAWM